MNVHTPAVQTVKKSKALHYSAVAIVLHWSIAAAIVVQIALGWRMGELTGLGRSIAQPTHKSLGIAVHVLTLVRLGWRLANPPPATDAKLDALESRLAHLVHLGFYAALLALPLTGWAASSLERSGGMKIFGGLMWPAFPLVSLIPSGLQDGLSELTFNAHGLLVWAMLGLLALHVAGALKHQFISRDATLARMAPGAKPGAIAEPRLWAIPVVAATLAAVVYLPVPPEAPARPKPASLAQADIYLDIVAPALDRRCSSCHSDDQSRGGLSLTSYDALMHGGRDGAVVTPRDSTHSELLRRVHLPSSDKHYMPQGDKPPLSPEQIAAIAVWIDAGAPASGKVGTLKLTGAQRAALKAALPGDEGGASDEGAAPAKAGFDENAGLPKVQPGDADAIKALESSGFVVRPIAADSNLLDVGFTVKRDLTPADIANLKKIGPQILHLNLHWSNLTDAQARELSGFANLRHLKLDNTAVGDAGLTSLSNLKALNNLSLTNTKVTDAGLASLGALPRLHRLYTWGSSVTPAGVQKLKAARPDLSVDGGLTRADVPPPGPLMQPVN
jgi:cytochrome b561/mono/diheme cytochrome c family protein